MFIQRHITMRTVVKLSKNMSGSSANVFEHAFQVSLQLIKQNFFLTRVVDVCLNTWRKVTMVTEVCLAINSEIILISFPN